VLGGYEAGRQLWRSGLAPYCEEGSPSSWAPRAGYSPGTLHTASRHRSRTEIPPLAGNRGFHKLATPAGNVFGESRFRRRAVTLPALTPLRAGRRRAPRQLSRSPYVASCALGGHEAGRVLPLARPRSSLRGKEPAAPGRDGGDYRGRSVARPAVARRAATTRRVASAKRAVAMRQARAGAADRRHRGRGRSG
jgi:hypothetical protein